MTWLGEGLLVDDQAETNSSFGRDAHGVLLTADPPHSWDAAPPDLSGLRRRGEPVSWLWVLAVDAAIVALARDAGPVAAIDALRSAGRGWIHDPA
jgi:hypothetical protein